MNTSKRAVTIMFLIGIMIGAGSLIIIVQGMEGQDKFTIQDDTKPRSDSLVFTGLPVTFDTDGDSELTSAGTAESEGVKIISSQRIQFNVMGDRGDEIDIAIPLVNHSKDTQIIMLECTAPETIGVDIEPQDAFVTTDGLRLVEKNTWLLTVEETEDDLLPPPGNTAEYNLEVVPKVPGAFQVTCQILQVG